MTYKSYCEYAIFMNMAMTLRTARESAGLTQAELAERAGMTQSIVARIERAGSNPTLATAERLLRATGHTLAVETTRVPSGVDESQIRERLRLSPGERLRTFEASHRNLGALKRKARRVGR
jgi:transcriptional regulator with XRE-family HTH domain